MMDMMRQPSDLLLAARDCERQGRVADAIQRYEAAILDGERAGDSRVLSEALRRLAVIRHQLNECDLARILCLRSTQVADAAGHDILVGESFNTMGVMLLREGALDDAEEMFVRAVSVAGDSPELCARAEQNLGIIANIHGEHSRARGHYTRSLESYQTIDDDHGCALAYHNLGIVSMQHGEFQEAERFLGLSLDLATRNGDVRMQALCMLNQADVNVGRQRFVEAEQKAEQSLAIFEQLGARDHTSGAHRVIGVVLRETGRHEMAETRLRLAISLAIAAGSTLLEAEAARELGIVYEEMGRTKDALGVLESAQDLFRTLGARLDFANVSRRIATIARAAASPPLNPGHAAA